MNQVIIVGNLTKDPEERGGVTDIALATNERRKVDGEWTEVTEFHDMKLFGNNAEFANKYLGKGSKVAITGSLVTEKWQNKEGQNRSKKLIYVSRLEAVSSKADNEAARGGRTAARETGQESARPF